MHIQSGKGYNPPRIASFYMPSVLNSNSLEVVAGDDGDIVISLGPNPSEANLSGLLHRVPVIRKKSYWFLEKRWACLYYPEWDTPLYLNKAAKQFCQLCNGENTFLDILKEMVKANSKYDREIVADDSIRFLFLLKRLKLITVRRGHRL
ncbi:MAG: hypothetical protein JXN10_09090 [Clostridia bacterium]|nr:hypothetical protein [Clostridia bacterium]